MDAKYNSVSELYPLGQMQRGLLFEIVHNNASGHDYILQMVFEINKPLHTDSFVQAWNIVVRSHETLRSGIVFDANQTNQVVCDNIHLPLYIHDYSSLDGKKQEEKFRTFLDKNISLPFKLSEPPLMNLNLFKLSHNAYRLVWTRHHLLLDGSSARRVVDDLFTVYKDLVANDFKLYYPSRSPRLVYENAVKSFNANYDRAKAYWQESLSNAHSAAKLPQPDVDNDKSAKFNVEREKLRVEGKTFEDMETFIQTHNCSTNILLQTAWAILLSHYTNHDVIMYGTVRRYPRDDVGDAVGLFINTLPIKVDVSPEMIVSELVKTLLSRNQMIREHIYSPLNEIKKWSGISQDVDLYQTIIDYKPSSINQVLKDKHSQIGCSVQQLRLETPYPMVLEIVNEGSCFDLYVHYDSARFSREYIQSFSKHYLSIIKNIVSKKAQRISDIPKIDNEQVVKFERWNDTAKTFLKDVTVSQLFESCADKYPDNIALVGDFNSWSYHDLNSAANQFAHFLIGRGVKRGDFIGTCFGSVPEMIISILGVLKAGASYVPMSGASTLKHLQGIVNDVNPKYIVVGDEYMSRFGDSGDVLTSVEVIEFDQIKMSDEYKSCSKRNPDVVVEPDDLMYIIYTSGSTGNPKGVEVEHASVINTLFACIDRLKVNEKSCVAQLALQSFDVCVSEWGMALLTGARLCLIRQDRFSIEVIADAFKKHAVTHTISVPSIYNALFQYHEPEEFPSLRVIAPGGGICNRSFIDKLSEKFEIHNIFGITETSICNTSHLFKPGDSGYCIGGPLENNRIYVLDKNLQHCPIDVVGEIYIAGESVARGYHNNETLTAERFFPDPFTSKSGVPSRMYKTGDLGRWTSVGVLKIVGRLDDQVKVRGFRLHLSEVERVAGQYPGIKEACVVKTEFKHGDGLVLFVIPHNQMSFDKESMLVFLRSRLALFMLPAVINALEEWPRTLTGKIDKKQLLDMLDVSSASEVEVVKSSEENEKVQQVVSSIKSLLGDIEVSKEANFIDLGLDSIMLAQLNSKLSKDFGYKIPISKMFEHPNIKDFSDYLEGVQITLGSQVQGKEEVHYQ